MTKWDYKIIDSRDVAKEGMFRGRTRDDIEAHLNQLGDDGWEVVNLDFSDLHESTGFFFGIAKRVKAE